MPTPLNQIGYKRIILSAGHGGGDSGAVSPQGHKEADQTIYIVDKMAQILKANNYSILVCPHNLDSARHWVNANDSQGDLAIEIHRDSASGLSEFDASTRIGCYYTGGSNFAKSYSDEVMGFAKAQTGNKNCWSRPDTQVRFGRLEWSRDVEAFSLLFEMAFMQGKNSNEHLDYLANLGAKMINKIWTGQDNFQNTKPAPTVININQPIQNNTMTDLNQKLKIAFIDNNRGHIWKEREDVLQNAINTQDYNYLGAELGWAWDSSKNLTVEVERLLQSEVNKDNVIKGYTQSIDKTTLELSNQIKILEAQIGVLQEEKKTLLENDTNWQGIYEPKIEALQKELGEVKLSLKDKENQILAGGKIPNATAELIAKIDSDSQSILLKFLGYVKNLPIATKLGGGSLAILIPMLQTQIEQSNFSVSSLILTGAGMVFTLLLPTNKK